MKPLRLAIIGGGFTGAMLAIHALRQAAQPLDITIVEPSGNVGLGTAYGTDDPAHRINVPTDRMAISKDDATQATRWFTERGMLPDADSDDGQGQYYVSRQAYGAFVTDVLRRATDGARYRHLPANATRVTQSPAGWQVATDTAGTVEADIVAFCFGHAAPALPCPIGADVAGSAKFVPDPWAEQALARIDPEDSVLVVGTGLTMADVVMSLRATGRRGRITAISRRGLLPRSHGLFMTDIDLFEGVPAPRTALGLLRLLRKRIRADETLGWQPFVDSLRFQLPDVWNALPANEQRLVLRRLLPFWDVHRFRIAPQVSAALDRARATGGLSVEKAAIKGLAFHQGAYAASLRRPGGSVEEQVFDAVVLCTGPDKDVAANPLVAALLADGAARLDRAGLGLAVDRRSRIIDAAGEPRPGLFAFGPMTRGSFGEMTGAPDIAKHIEQVVPTLLGS